jgi:DNA-binding transcriptional MerR regulator
VTDMPATTVTIGEFSRLTHLSVKTLHHYHDVGLLAPAIVDPATGYRRYRTQQARQAHLIRWLRDLGMPVPAVRDLVGTDDPAARDAILRRHLAQMQAELRRTQEAVASLEALLRPAGRAGVTYRTLPPQPVLRISGEVGRDEVEAWCRDGIARLSRAAVRAGADVTGVPGGSFSMSYFENEAGPVTVFLPVHEDTGDVHGADRATLPGGRFAVATHAGGFEDFDQTYGDLGAYVAEHDAALPDPIREYYLINHADTTDERDWRTEICWPVSPQGPAADM